MTHQPASVIIVSRHRAAALVRCLAGLTQQDHPAFEVIVVADPEGIAAAEATGLPLKCVTFDQANISAARNLGLAQAAAPVVAFIDDDAVAEPTWLSRLTAPFDNPQVVAATGFVRGRNGISLQWGASVVDAQGQDHPFGVEEAGELLPSSPDRAIKTQGTNCAFRTGPLRTIGGFDPAYRFYLDEADVNLRLGPLGLTAVMPLAQVHHGYEASARRRADRVPTSLHEIAASTAVFLRRHAPDTLEAGLIRLKAQQQARIITYLRSRRLTGAEAEALEDSLHSGWADGIERPLPPLVPLMPEAVAFLPLPGTGPRPGLLIAGRIWQRRAMEGRALAALALPAAPVVTLICLAPHARPHHAWFDPRGFWVQQGGLFGRSLRQERRVIICRFSTRLLNESARLAKLRPIAGATDS